MLSIRTIELTSLAIIAMAGNSLLTRVGLRQSSIDAASFAVIRLISGAVVLWLITRFRRSDETGRGSWRSALALFSYATCFSFAYVSMPAATGSLLLFGTVQATMISYGIWIGERLQKRQIIGLALAFTGLVVLLMPGFSAPPLIGSILMTGAGISWGVYSLRGRGEGNPIQVTAGNFLRAVPFAVGLKVVMNGSTSLDSVGILYAILSGAVTSGLGYSIWYTALPVLRATQAAIVQLSVPLLASLGGFIFLHESLTLRFVLAAVSIFSGITLVIVEKRNAAPTGLMDNLTRSDGISR